MAEEALRRAGGDEPGVARALALAAEATEMSGQKALAADLWFRSGRSAAQEGDAEAATRLRRAETLARQTGQPALANEARGLRLGLKPSTVGRSRAKRQPTSDARCRLPLRLDRPTS